MYEKFLDKNPNSICQTVDDVFIAKYANVVSENIITLWKEVGFGMFCEGLFRIIEPNEYQAIILNINPVATIFNGGLLFPCPLYSPLYVLLLNVKNRPVCSGINIYA